jgi:transcription elongation factor Elf1
LIFISKNQFVKVKIKISATFYGKCDICGKEGLVFKVGDEETKRVVIICEDCVKKYSSTKVGEIIDEFGRKDEESFNPGIKNLSENN